MQEAIIQYISNFGLLGLFFLMIFNGFIGIIPSEIVLFFGGIFASTYPNVSILHVIFLGTLGNILGAILLYFMGRLFGYNWLLRLPFVKKFINRETLDQIAEKYRIEGACWAGVFRCMPVVRTIVSLPAGMIHMPFWIFFFYSTTGMLIWSLVWVSLGYFLGIAFIWLNDYIMWAMVVLSIFAIFYFKNISKAWLKLKKH